MSQLVERLTAGTQRLMLSSGERGDGSRALRHDLERRLVHLRFPDTHGGTELTVSLDARACDLSLADFGADRGSLHLEGMLRIDQVALRVVAEVDLRSREGTGELRIVQPACVPLEAAV